MHNIDEHGLQEGDSRPGKVLGDALTNKALVSKSDNRTWVMILESGNAQGKRLQPTVVFTGTNLQEQWFPEAFPS